MAQATHDGQATQTCNREAQWLLLRRMTSLVLPYGLAICSFQVSCGLCVCGRQQVEGQHASQEVLAGAT